MKSQIRRRSGSGWMNGTLVVGIDEGSEFVILQREIPERKW
jgi:hypothetical protein